MNKITIKVGDSEREVAVPDSWNDLDLRTLLLFYNTLFAREKMPQNTTAFTRVKIISMAQHLARLDVATMAEWEADCIADAGSIEIGETVFLEELREVVHHAIGGLFDVKTEEDGPTTYAPKLNLTTNPWPKFSHTPPASKGRKEKTTWLYAPADGLANVTLYELAMSFTLFENYLKTEDEEMANRLLATIYRPSRPESQAERDSEWFGDRRMPLRKYEKTIDKRTEQMKTLPILTRRVLMFWFASCRQSIVQRFPKVFTSDGGEGGTNYGWGGVLLAMAGGPVGLEQIADQAYSNGLTWLSMKEDERRALEAAAKKKG
jgi:hypothetical protein